MLKLKQKALIILTKVYLWSAGILKKHDAKFARRLRRALYRRVYRHVQMAAPPQFYPGLLGEWFWFRARKELDLDAPQGFCQKLQWLKINDSTPLKTRLVDKYLAREWVSDKIGERYLIPLLGVWDKYDDINFEALPEQFVLKANHGSGMNCIVTNKNEIDHKKNRETFSKWMNTNYAFYSGLELQYKDVPRKIIAEKYLEDGGSGLYDYRFFCAHGEVVFYRITENATTLVGGFCFDRQKKRLFVKFGREASDAVLRVNEVANIDEMWRLSEILAKGFPFVRVDWYEVNGKNYLGEMTFTPSSGLLPLDDKLDMELGNQIRLPVK